MAFVPRVVRDRIVSFPGRYQLSLVPGETTVYDLTPVPGTITEPGTDINKAYLQPIEDGIAAVQTTANNAQTVANAAVPKTGGVMSGLLSIIRNVTLGTTVGNVVELSTQEAFTGSNQVRLVTRLRRRVAGTEWEKADIEFLRVTDATGQQAIILKGDGNIDFANTANLLINGEEIKRHQLLYGQAVSPHGDPGIYNQATNWVRYVTNGGTHIFYTDGGAGTTPVASINPGGIETNFDVRAGRNLILRGENIPGLRISPAGTLEYWDGGAWRVIWNGNNTASNGSYQLFPSGAMISGGVTGQIQPSNNVVVAYPLAYSFMTTVVATADGLDGTAGWLAIWNVTTAGFTIRNNGSGPHAARWFAFGFR